MILFILILLWFIPGINLAVGPLEKFQGLVAGQGQSGYQDGAFNRALFNNPTGLAIGSDNSTLYVADKANHLIRTISLDRKNEVKTLAGTGKAGDIDGSFRQAAFNEPSALALLPDDQLAVFDQGNSLIRVLDLKSESVSVLAGNGKEGAGDGPALNCSLSNVWNMAYYPPDHCLYFSQPTRGLLRRVNLDNQKVETLLANDARIPQPAALCVIQKNIYVSNAGVTGTVLRLRPNPKAAKDLKPSDEFFIENAGQGQSIIALAGLDDFLYGIQGDPDVPLREFLPQAVPVTLITYWGEPYVQNQPAWPLFDNSDTPAGFVADPLSKRHFFLCNPPGNFVASVKDLNQGVLSQQEMLNSSQLHEFEYPPQKPPRTMRIMIVGRSYVASTYERLPAPPHYTTNRMPSLSNRLELFLNLSASLEDQPLRFEVFNCGQIMTQSLYLWPMDLVPDLVKKYDIDLVLLIMDPGIHMEDYYRFPPAAQGLPSNKFDPEYILKPNAQRIPPGVPKKFFDLCRKNKLLYTPTDTSIGFHSFKELLSYPEIKDCLLTMVGKPLDALHQRLKAIKLSSGSVPGLELCFFPGTTLETETYSQVDFWHLLSRQLGLDMVDLSDIFSAQRLALYPVSELGGMNHFDNDGNLWLSFILTHELIAQKIIPWTASKP